MASAILDRPVRRRIIGAGSIVAGMVVAAIVLIGGGESTGKSEPARVTRTAAIPRVGMSVSYPRSWRRHEDGRVVRLRSPEGGVLVTLASPVAGRFPAAVKRALMAELRRRLAPARVLRQGPSRLGPRRATSFELSGRSGGRAVRALGIVDSTAFRTYAVTIITAAAPSARRLAETQGILHSLRFSRPQRRAG